MSDDAEFKAIFTGDNSQFKTSVDESLAYLSKLVNGAYDFGTALQNPVEMLQKFNQVNTEISSNFKIIDQFKALIAEATDVTPILARISEFTGINFLEADANIAVFKNGLLQLNDYSLATKSAFAGIAEQIGKDNPILLDYAKVLQLVNTDLSSLSQTSSFFSVAQAALKDPIQLAALAMEQFDAKIINTTERLVSLLSGLDLTGVKFTSLESYITSIAKEYKNAESAILSFSEANAGNIIKIEMAIQRLQQYLTTVEELKNGVRGYIQLIQDAGRADEVFVNKKGEAITKSQMLTKELGAITNALLSENAIQQALNLTQDASLKTLLSLMDAYRSGNIIFKEMLALLPQVTTATSSLTSTQKLLAQLLDDITTKFGAEFVSIFQAIVAQVTLTDQSLLMLYSRFVTTAQAITQLLAQGQQLVGMFMNQVQAQNSATLSLQNQYTIIQQMITWYAQFKASLQSVNTVQAGMVGNQNNVTQSLLSQQTVMNSATGVYNNFLSASRALVTIQAQTAQATQSVIPPVQQLSNSQQALANILASLKDAFSTFFSTLKSFAVFTAASAVISGITDAFRSVISSASEFDQILHSLKAITGATSSEMAGMNDVIKNMASNSTYSIEAIGKGLQNMAQAGFTVEESANAIQAATNLAMGTLEKLENTVDLVTSTLVSYGMSSLEAGRVSDILATAVNQSKLSIDGLRTSLNYVGVIAAQSGLSLQETTASLMVLADRGMKASTMGTGLRQVLDKLIAPNEKLRDAYQAHGIELDKISPLTAGYETAIKNLATALWDSETQTVNTSKAFELFGIRGAQAAAILIQTYVSGEWQDSLNSLDRAGTAAKMAAEQMEGLTSQWEKLQAKASALSASLGEGGLVTIMKSVVSVLTGMVDGLQAFFNFDFGWFGTVTEVITSFITALTVGTVAVYVANTAWKALGNTAAWLTTNITDLITKVKTFYAVLVENPFMLVIVLLASLYAAVKTYSTNLQESITAHIKLANEAKQTAGILNLFSESIEKLKDNQSKLAVEVNRLKSEFPELVKEIENVAKVTDIATLSQEDLLKSLKTVQSIELEKSLREYTKAYLELQDSLGNSNAEMVKWAKILLDVDIPLRTMIGTSDKLTESLKNIGKTLIAQGKEVEGGLDKQREAALKALNIFLDSNAQMETSRESLTKTINESFDKEDARLQRSKEFNQKQFNDIGQFYKDLSALERAEIQTTFDEQRKAEEKLKDMRTKGLISEEEYQSSIYATKMKYLFKELALIDENKKKQYETSLEKYTREIVLIDKQIQFTQESLDKEKILYDSLASYLGGLSEQQEKELLAHFENIATAKELLEQKRREKSKVTYENQKQLADDFLKNLQANYKLQLASLEGLEVQKAQIELESAQKSLELIQERIEAEKKKFVESLKGVEATEQQQLEYNERLKELILQEIDARTEVTTKTIALSKTTYAEQKKISEDLLSSIQSNQKLQLSVLQGFENEKMRIEQVGAEASLKLIQQRIDAENDRFQKATEATGATAQQMQEHTERMKDLIKQEVEARADAITKTVAMGQQLVDQLKEQLNKDLETTKSIYQAKSDIAKQHYDSVLFDAQNALTKEYEEINKKVRNEEVVNDLQLQAKIAYWDKSLQLTLQASEEESRIRQEEYEKSKAIIDQKLQVQSDYSAKVKGLWDSQSQYTQVTEQQQLESAQRLMTEQETLMKGHTSIFQSESGKRIQTIIDEAAVAGQSIEDQVNEHGIAYVKMTGVTAEELRKQQVDFIQTKDGIFQVITQQTLKVQEAAVQETKAYRDGMEEQKKLSLEAVQDQIKNLGDRLSAVKKTLADEYAEHQKIVEDIKKLRESLVTTHEKVEDAIRKVRQTTMTDEKKYYDDIKIADEALNKARTTGMKEYVDDAWSKITSLSTGTIKLDNGTQLSAKQTAAAKEKFMREYEEVAKAVIKGEIERQEKAKEALEATMKKHQETMEEIKLKLIEFQQLEIKLNTEKFTQSIDKILLGIDDVIGKLKSIRDSAPVEIDISRIDKSITTAISQIAKIKPEIEKIKQTPAEVMVTGGKDQTPLADYLDLMKGSLKAFDQYIGKDLKPALEIVFQATGYENKTIATAVDEIKASVKTLVEGDGSVNSTKPKLDINAEMNGVNDTATTIATGVANINTELEKIPKATKSKHTIDVIGLADLQAAIDKHSQLDGAETHSYHTIHVTTVNDGEGGGSTESRTGGYIAARIGGFIQNFATGGAFTGKLPGYGGGDIVNARLEPGEFVLRKEAVKNIGVNALRQWNNLNSEAQRTLNPQAGASSSNQMFTGQLHTIDLNIGNDSNRIYAEPNVLNNLTSSLRRARLMKA